MNLTIQQIVPDDVALETPKNKIVPALLINYAALVSVDRFGMIYYLQVPYTSIL